MKVLGIVGALAPPIAPAQAKKIAVATPGTVVDDRLRHIHDAIAGLQQAVPNVVILRGGEGRPGPKSLVEYTHFLERSSMARHVP